MHPELREILFLDIETVAQAAHYRDLSERYKTHWARKASFLKREPLQSDEDLYHERAGIYAEFGQVVCVVVGKLFNNEQKQLCLKTKAYCSTDEDSLLKSIKDLFEKLDPASRLCAHNGKEFDYPYLSRRMLIRGIALPPILNLAGRKPWEVPHLDTLELWKFGDYKHYTSLDLLATVFEIPTSKGDMDGSRVNHVYHHDKDLAKIADYCTRDVVALTQLYLRMKGIKLIEEQNIVKT
jgi:DNA polymerase elongation subunit (family B)